MPGATAALDRHSMTHQPLHLPCFGLQLAAIHVFECVYPAVGVCTMLYIIPKETSLEEDHAQDFVFLLFRLQDLCNARLCFFSVIPSPVATMRNVIQHQSAVWRSRKCQGSEVIFSMRCSKV